MTFRSWRLIPLGLPSEPKWNMTFDEKLLDTAPLDEPVLRFYTWSRPALSIGYFQDPETVRGRYASDPRGWDMVRRITGGGTVEHGEDLTMSLVIAVDNPYFASRAIDSYRDIHELLRKSLEPKFPGLRPVDAPRFLKPRAAGNCFEEPVSFDLEFQEKKLSAQVSAAAGA